MGNVLSDPVRNPTVLRFVEYLTKPPALPLDLTQTAQIEQEPPEVLITRARLELGLDTAGDFNFAVVGASGVGKSSFVNGIRLIDDSQPDAAPVGETTDMQRCPHPLLRHVVLWDLPGAGTPKHPAGTYFRDMKLYAFDCILIISSNRFSRVDFDVAKQALRYKRRCAFVRTKADEAVKSIAERTGKGVVDASKELRDKVEASFREALRLAGLSSKAQELPLFFVSSRAFTERNAYSLVEESHEEIHEETATANATATASATGTATATPAAAIEEEEDEETDTILRKMDEDNVYRFLADSVRSRTLRSLSMKTLSTRKPAGQPPQA